MIAYSTRPRPIWTLTAHGQRRAHQRGISRQDVLAAICGPHYTRPSAIPGSRLSVVTGVNGVVAVVDAAQRVIITVYRRPPLSGISKGRRAPLPAL